MTGTTKKLSTPLIRRLDSSGSNGNMCDPRLEQAFFLEGQSGLRPGTFGRTESAKTYLAHTIARRPAELRLHIQRIWLHLETDDPGVLAALWDLFLILGDKGLPLRKRMLTLARPLLDETAYGALLQYAEESTQSPPVQHLCAGVLLSRGITGTTRLITRVSTREAVRIDPLDSAGEQLLCGQPELAQSTLEKALLDDPERLELHQTLLEIYHHARDRKHILRFWETIQGLPNPASAEWQELLEQLQEEARTS